MPTKAEIKAKSNALRKKLEEAEKAALASADDDEEEEAEEEPEKPAKKPAKKEKDSIAAMSEATAQAILGEMRELRGKSKVTGKEKTLGEEISSFFDSIFKD